MQNQEFRQNQLLLLEDVINVGRKGDIVKVKPGFARNFLLPQKKAVVADNRTIRMQQKLQEERAKQAEIDRNESEKIRSEIEDKVFTTQVKIDPEGNLYGSVAAQDIVDILAQEGVQIEKRFVRIGQPIRSLGKHKIWLKLKEGVETSIILQVEGDRPLVSELKEEEKKEESKPAEEVPAEPEEK
ncbi:MAG: 50S ribosomal protein L9 [Simkaniaceae bacterium]